MKFLILAFLMNGFFAHDIQVAFFKIHQESERLGIEIIMEKDDVKSTFDVLDLKLTNDNFQDYIRKNMSLLINKEKQILCFENMQVNKKHIVMTCNINEVNAAIQSIELMNTCLLNLEDHSNIIEVRINGSEKDFLMNMERTTISVNY